MIVGKYKTEDLLKLKEEIAKSRRAVTFTVTMDGPKLLFSYTGDDDTVHTITLFDESTSQKPTISKTDYL